MSFDLNDPLGSILANHRNAQKGIFDMHTIEERDRVMVLISSIVDEDLSKSLQKSLLNLECYIRSDLNKVLIKPFKKGFQAASL